LRKFPGLSSLDDPQAQRSLKKQIYQTYLESHTTINGITPEEVHNMGIDEIARLKSEVMKIVNKELKMPDVTFKEFFQILANDKLQEFASENEVMEYYTKIIRYIKTKILLSNFSNLKHYS
jgi:uncharacterized protein (DUF885 family)